MRLVNYGHANRPGYRLGLVHEDCIIDVPEAAEICRLTRSAPRTVDEYLSSPGEVRRLVGRLCTRLDDLLAEPRVTVSCDAVRFGPTVLAPGKMLAVGRNYRAHRAELGEEPEAALPAVPSGFVKLRSALTGHRELVVLPPWPASLDYEAELVVIIGRAAHDVPVADAIDYVAGYTVGNDISARSVQADERAAGGGPLVAKNAPTFAPLGPWLVTAADISDPMNLRVWSTVNDELRQDDSTSGMIFGISELIAWYSRIGLDPGDVLYTGTPSGVGLATNRYLRQGDVVACGVDGVGVLVNSVSCG